MFIVLENLGLSEIKISDEPLDILGVGSSAAVHVYASRDDASQLVSYSMAGRLTVPDIRS